MRVKATTVVEALPWFITIILQIKKKKKTIIYLPKMISIYA